MSKFSKSIICGALAGICSLGTGQKANGFAITGNFASFQTPLLGYNRAYLNDLGGPMLLGDEYRWNVPVIVYAFDRSFDDYFGKRGMQEVGKAFQIYNNLPPVSKMSAGLTEYPLDTTHENYRASTLGIVDLKSFTLSALTEPLGLINAERFVWTLYSRIVVAGVPQYQVISRNFDPVTLEATNAVNGAHYGYVINEYTTPQYTDADEYQKADPGVRGFSSVSGGFNFFLPGTYFGGLTRDDVGGLRYLYNPKNYNVEGINLNTTFLNNNQIVAAGSTISTAQNFNSPYNSAFGSIITTNIVTTNSVTVTNTGGFSTNPPINITIRGGIDKINFVPGKFDSLIGLTFIQMTNSYSDRFVTNSTIRSQLVSRVIGSPDMIFTAEDLGQTTDGFPGFFSRGLVYTSFAANNTSVGARRPGPGTLSGPYIARYSNLYPIYFNSGDSIVDDTGALIFRTWGTFDGSSEEPIVYPSSASIEELEANVLRP